MRPIEFSAKAATMLFLLLAGSATYAQKICPSDFQGRQKPDAICWKKDKDGLYRQWSEVRGFLPGDTLKIEGNSIKRCNFAGERCRIEMSSNQ
jgi:hypothetical protein